jgi:hypothetical protein
MESTQTKYYVITEDLLNVTIQIIAQNKFPNLAAGELYAVLQRLQSLQTVNLVPNDPIEPVAGQAVSEVANEHLTVVE